MTFSVAVAGRERSFLFVATASCYPSVGRIVPHVEGGVGAMAVQGSGTQALGVEILAGLARGGDATAVAHRVLERDVARDERQVAVVGAAGDSFAETGAAVPASATTATGHGYACAGNFLDDPRVVSEMAAGAARLAEGHTTSGLLEGLGLLALGESRGGDARGRLAAAATFHGTRAHPWMAQRPVRLDVRIDTADTPLRELERAASALLAYELVTAAADDAVRCRDRADVEEIIDELVSLAPGGLPAFELCRRVIKDRHGQLDEARSLARAVGRRVGVSDALGSRLIGDPAR